MPQSPETPEPTDTWDVGAARITRVEEATTPIPAQVLMPDFTEELLETNPWVQPHWFDESGLLRLSVHTFVVESGPTTIVIDTCAGTEPERPLPGDAGFPDRLGRVVDGGLAGVDMVLCTHLHFDHVGWNTVVVDGVRRPTFPEARYLFAREELEHLEVDDHMAVREPAVQPLLDAGMVDVVETDQRLTPEVRLIPTPGHTPGHVSVLVESQGHTALITGDAVHSPLQFAVPTLASSAFDWDSAMSTRTREDLVAAHVDRPTLVLGTHFARPSGGHLRGDGDRVWFEPR